MKKVIFILSVLFICNTSFAKSNPDSLSESIFYSNIFTSFYYLDNSDLNTSLNYWQKAFDISKSIDNKKIKAYASAFRAVWFQTKFPEAKDIIGRQSNLADAISNYNSIVTKTELDKKILSLLNTLIDNRFYNLSADTFIQTYNEIIKEKASAANEFLLYFLKYFSSEDKFLKYIDDYTYYLGGDYLTRARHHADIALTVLNDKSSTIYFPINPEFHLKKALSYYKKASALNTDSSISNNNSEIEVLNKRLLTINSDYYSKKTSKHNEQFQYAVQTSYLNNITFDNNPPFCDGTKYAAIEIGAKGVKLSVICLNIVNRVDYEYEILKTDKYEAEFAKLGIENLNKTYYAIRNFYDTIVNLYNIPDAQIFIAFSSGAVNKTTEKNRPGVIDSLKERLLNNHIFRNNSTITIATLPVNEEARLTLLGIVTSAIRPIIYTAGIFDIGTGNVKGGFCKENNCSAFNFPYIESNWGLEKLLSTLPKNPDLSNRASIMQYADAADRLIRNVMKDDIGSQLISTGLRDKRQIFTTGGIFWAIAALTHPQEVIVDKRNYVQITEADVRAFRRMALENYPIDPVGNTPEINKGFREVTTVFPQDQAIVGSTLVLQAFAEFNKSSQRPKQYYYSKFSLVGWPSGFIIQQQSE